MIGDKLSPIEAAFYAMDEALRHPVSIAIEYAVQGIKTGLPEPTEEDLDGLFRAMTKAAHLFRLHEGPPPARDPDGWRRVADKCAAICREASMQYILLCASAGVVIGGTVRDRLDSWNYMANLFSSWPAFSGCTATEPSSITAEVAKGAREGKPLYYLSAHQSGPDLACIFARLVEAGFIDGSAPDAMADFLRAFDPAADRQGRITWIKAAKNHGLNKMAICDFLRLFGITEREDLREYALAIFGMTLSKSTLTNSAGGSTERDALRTIIEKAAKQ